MSLTIAFNSEIAATLNQAGGKALSLILMTRRGLPVPPGCVLTVDFFAPWLEALQATPEWNAVQGSAPEARKPLCDALKARCDGLRLDAARRDALTTATAALRVDGALPLLAVRSSSPEEDLENFSFAGGYETVLGVTADTLEDAVRRAFASCLDARVLSYKQEHGLPVDRPRIAVIVQQQVAADTAGVAFSLNPLNNCYDEAVINANFGLGESVVAGMASPDTFTVDKVGRAILESRTGGKEISVWLTRTGGTHRAPAPERAQLCLTGEQVLAITDILVQVEEYFGKPIDIEWAFAAGRLYLLQARPITAYVPLPQAMQTKPGEPRMLYADQTLIKWGMPAPVSVLGTDLLCQLNLGSFRSTAGRSATLATVQLTRPTYEGRSYLHVSHSLKMIGRKRAAATLREIDGLTADLIAGLGEHEYVPGQLPPPLRGLLLKMVRENLGTGMAALRALLNPEAARQQYLREEQRFWQGILADQQEAHTPKEFVERALARLPAYLHVVLPVVLIAQLGRARLDRLFKDEPADVRARVADLSRALPDNVTIAMGLAMCRLARFPEVSSCPSGAEFAAQLRARDGSPEFLAAWDAFIADHGFRCAMEMDPATPRPYEQPERFFEQLRALGASAGGESDPLRHYEQLIARREQAYADLLALARKKGGRTARQLADNYRMLVEYGGFRESPKYWIVRFTDLFRQRALAAGRALCETGRLDRAEQVFDLTLDELDRAIGDATPDLRALAERNARYQKRLQQVREFPRLIDSRGRILRAPRKAAGTGELAGQPISPGVARGPVKVLHSPDEKIVRPGDILVAPATDPGWTPLFINAAGVILEVGGLLQHGALVAREYGKPCVAGIEGATAILKDGQIVELDGAGGVVHVVQEALA